MAERLTAEGLADIFAGNTEGCDTYSAVIKEWTQMIQKYGDQRAVEARKEALEALEELMDWQNGPPLPSYKKGWTAAM